MPATQAVVAAIADLPTPSHTPIQKVDTAFEHAKSLARKASRESLGGETLVNAPAASSKPWTTKQKIGIGLGIGLGLAFAIGIPTGFAALSAEYSKQGDQSYFNNVKNQLSPEKQAEGQKLINDIGSSNVFTYPSKRDAFDDFLTENGIKTPSRGGGE